MQAMDGSECVEDTMNRSVNEAQKYNNNFDIEKKRGRNGAHSYEFYQTGRKLVSFVTINSLYEMYEYLTQTFST